MTVENISIHTTKGTIIGITDIMCTINAMIAGINITNVMTDGITGIHTIKATIIGTTIIINIVIAMITDQMAIGLDIS